MNDDLEEEVKIEKLETGIKYKGLKNGMTICDKVSRGGGAKQRANDDDEDVQPDDEIEITESESVDLQFKIGEKKQFQKPNYLVD